ncbi:FtsX-like permease family protein [Parvicella tangerina]|uniref:Lipoprotein-releasing system transmembrane protein LolE n=1 Tax=Parvicella tangerina TaxID=2829795 RepID=A0A916NJI9_9FLAO|nr:FtsX-like permease family protein [Parvicella tangerina]CAG5086144.1 Lipoprotein-releasing system transmembrane protein LolE [Parvicella tangerina]
MKTTFYIARRYFFSRKSKSVINITSAISVLGIFVSTAAMIIVLSGFNGIESLVKELYSHFDPDITFTPAKGKSFHEDEIDFDQLMALEEVAYAYPVIEEITMVKHEEQYVFATMKGVGDVFFQSGLLEKSIFDGEGGIVDYNTAIVGYGVQGKLQVAASDMYDNKVKVYGLLRTEKASKNNQEAFKSQDAYVRGVFSVNPEFDNKFILVSLDFARDLLEYEGDYTKFEVQVNKGFDPFVVKEKILGITGDTFTGKTRYELNEIIFKTNETEKWMVFLILGFIMIISTFNIIASLSMLILDKQKDIKTLISLGASQKMIKQIFILEGLMINFIGAFLGGFVGFAVCWAQIKFHFVKMENSVTDYWPVIVKWQDVLMIFSTVLIIGVVSSYLPVNYLVKRHFSQMFKRS